MESYWRTCFFAYCIFLARAVAGQQGSQLVEKVALSLYQAELAEPLDGSRFTEAIELLNGIVESDPSSIGQAERYVGPVLFECLHRSNRVQDAFDLADSLVSNEKWKASASPHSYGSWVVRRAAASSLLHHPVSEIIDSLLDAVTVAPSNTDLFGELVSLLNPVRMNQHNVNWEGLVELMEKVASLYEQERDMESTTKILFPMFDLLDMLRRNRIQHDHQMRNAYCSESTGTRDQNGEGTDVACGHDQHVLDDTYDQHTTDDAHVQHVLDDKHDQLAKDEKHGQLAKDDKHDQLAKDEHKNRDKIEQLTLRAWNILVRGNRLWRTHTFKEGFAYNTVNEDAQRDVIVRTFTKTMLHSLEPLRYKDPADMRNIIFIVGLPRAGSTLLDQMLQTHSLVGSVGEYSVFNSKMRQIRDDLIVAFSKNKVNSIAEVLEEKSKLVLQDTVSSMYHSGDESIVVDKMLFNYRNIGFIHLVLPDAKIIHVRKRSYWSHVFSLYKKAFAKGVAEWSYNFHDIAYQFELYKSIMAHWDTILPGKILHVDYEDIVLNTEATARRVAIHCNIPFEQSMIEPHKVQRVVYTQSSKQVNEPISHSSLRSWEPYKHFILQELEHEVEDKLGAEIVVDTKLLLE